MSQPIWSHEIDDIAARWPGVALFEQVLILQAERVELAAGVRIDSFGKIEGGRGVHIGACAHIGAFCSINIGGGEVWIGEHVGIGSGARILGGSNMPGTLSMSAASPADMQHVTRKVTHIGRYAFVASNAVVMPGVTLGEGAVLGAGGVATKDIPAWEIWGGVPARYIKDRPRPEHAPDLPSEGW